MLLYKGLIFTPHTLTTIMKKKPTASKGCLAWGFLGLLLVMSLSANYCMIRDNYLSTKHAPKANDYPVDLIYTLAPEDTERNIVLLDFQGSITIYQSAGANAFTHGEEIYTQKTGELGRYTLSVKVPENEKRVLILIRGTAITKHGDKPSFSL
jgi:hypothetical protein